MSTNGRVDSTDLLEETQFVEDSPVDRLVIFETDDRGSRYFDVRAGRVVTAEHAVVGASHRPSHSDVLPFTEQRFDRPLDVGEALPEPGDDRLDPLRPSEFRERVRNDEAAMILAKRVRTELC